MTKGLVLSSFLLSLIGSAAFAAPQLSLNAKDLIRIEIGSDEEDMPSVSQPQQVTYLVKKNSDLRRRVHRLEMALRQMQDQIYNLQETNYRQVAVAPAVEHTCYIKTTFKGTVYGKGGSEAEAKAKALKSCDDVDGGFSCEERNVRCGS